MTPFSFEHVFRAGSPAQVMAAFWDPSHQRAQDQALAIVERTVLELTETAEARVRVTRIVPQRQLPALVRPFVSGPLHYVETARWRPGTDVIELEILPSLLGGRAVIRATYRLEPAGTGLIRRTYAGSVSVDVALISSRIERGIRSELQRSLPLAAAVTQGWLDGPEPATTSGRKSGESGIIIR
ncbi:MAG: DUF2505 domain-containing protein [Myxococcales bacterium]|nr:DUF2505 domain-containing protein [Myxococcales bacterium]